jgi:hypothetical protein
MKLAFALFCLVATAATTAADERAAIRFTACPVYRDTDAGKKSGCWLADDPATGARYDVSSSPTKPDWNHAILVEGKRATGDANPCGGIVLDPVRVSVLDDDCTRFMLEAEGFAGRKFALPRRNIRPLYEARRPAAKPWQDRMVTVPFDFGSSFVTYQLSDYYIDSAINYALDVQPAKIVVTGYAATDPEVVSGRTLAEDPALARTRADLVARALVMRGIPAASITVTTGKPSKSADEAFDGLPGPSRRRVEVRITPVVVAQ